ncbi:MAG: alpha/beta fold hydrolase [Oscillospiraceae bacterium]
MPIIDLPLEKLQEYSGISPKPQDFDSYWQAALAELDLAAPQPRLQPAGFQAKGVECCDLTFQGVRGALVYAKYLRPTSPGSHPCLLCFHGYTMNSGSWSQYLPYVLQGFCVAAMDCRGQGGRSTDPGGVGGNTQHGHIIRGVWDGVQDLLFRHIFLDSVQLLRAVAGFAEVDKERIAAAGASQGGALAIACSALSEQVKRTVVQMPFLSDFRRTWEMGQGSNAYKELFDYFRLFDPLHEREEELFQRLGYIDVHFLAPQIRGSVLMAIGLADVTCLPSTQFAVYNALRCEKKLCLYPDFGHEPLPGFADTEFAFVGELS